MPKCGPPDAPALHAAQIRRQTRAQPSHTPLAAGSRNLRPVTNLSLARPPASPGHPLPVTCHPTLGAKWPKRELLLQQPLFLAAQLGPWRCKARLRFGPADLPGQGWEYALHRVQRNGRDPRGVCLRRGYRHDGRFQRDNDGGELAGSDAQRPTRSGRSYAAARKRRKKARHHSARRGNLAGPLERRMAGSGTSFPNPRDFAARWFRRASAHGKSG